MIKCAFCGKFISYKDIDEGKCRQLFTPDTHFTCEEVETVCPKCTVKWKDFFGMHQDLVSNSVLEGNIGT